MSPSPGYLPLFNETQFRRLLEALPAAAYTCDPDGFITFFNRRAAKLWGREPKLLDPLDRYCGSYKLYDVDGTPMPHEACWMALSLKHQRAFVRRKIVIERQDGLRQTVLAHANPIHDVAGRYLGAVNVIVDVTEPKDTVPFLLASQDLQELLGTIASSLRLLEDRCASQLDDVGRSYIDRAAKGTKRLQTLIFHPAEPATAPR